MRSAGFCFALMATVACGGDDDGGPGPAGGTFEVLDEGSGEANEGTLLPLRAGSVFPVRGGAVRAPIEIAPGRVVSRWLTLGQQTSMSGPLDATSENWLSQDETGIWFEGSTKGGILEVPILLVPAEVRVGMRWRTGGETTSRVYEVLSRDLLETAIGDTVLWTIEQQTEPPIYRLYAEGWGLVDVGEAMPTPSTWVPFSSMRAVTGDEPEPVQATGPSLSLRELSVEDAPERWDSVRAIRLSDGRTIINAMGSISGLTGTNLIAYDLVFEGSEIVATGMDGHFPSGVDATRISPWFAETAYERPGGGSGININGIGNVVHVGERILWSVEDMLIFENELGGVSGAVTNGFSTEGNFAFELTAVEPGYGEAFSMRPHWGGMSTGIGRVLLAGDAAPERVSFARVAGSLGELWTASSDQFADGRLLSVPAFVEAFPDAIDPGLGSFRGPYVSTTSGVDTQVHLFTSPGGAHRPHRGRC